MDRAELVARNREAASRRHQLTARARLRRRLLAAVARVPVKPRAAQRESILLIRPDHVGDVLFTAPAIRALARARPHAALTALVGPWSAGVMAPFDELARVLTLPFPGFARQEKPHVLAPYLLAWRSARRLRRLGASAAAIMRPDHWWGALVAYLAGIPVRVGYDVPEVAPFLTECVPLATEAHSVRLNLNLVTRWTGHVPDAAAALDYPVDTEDRTHLDDYLALEGCARGAPVVIIHPGAGSSYKTWLPARWAEVGDALAERLGARVVITGAAQEAHMARAVAREMAARPIIAVGRTTLGQLAALCARAGLVLGPDSGPLHLAVGVGTPTVHLYGPADPALYGPWGSPARHVALQSTLGCVPCGVLDWAGDDPALHPCVREISVAQVLAAAQAALTA